MPSGGDLTHDGSWDDLLKRLDPTSHDSHEDLLKRLYPLEPLREALWTKCDSWERFAVTFNPSGSGDVSAGIFEAGVTALDLNIHGLTGCRDSQEVFETFIDPGGLGVVSLVCLAQRLGIKPPLQTDVGDDGSEDLPPSYHQVTRSASSYSGRSVVSHRRAINELGSVEKQIQQCDAEAERLRAKMQQLKAHEHRPRSSSRSRSSDPDAVHQMHQSRVEAVMRRHRTQLLALQASTDAAKEDEVRAAYTEHALQKRLQQAQVSLTLTQESHAESEARLREAEEAYVSAEHTKCVHVFETQAALDAYKHIDTIVVPMRAELDDLKSERISLEAQIAAHRDQISSASSSHVRSHKLLLDKHSDLQSELEEERSQHASAVVRLEAEISGIEDDDNGPRAFVEEANSLYARQQSLVEAWTNEMEACAENRSTTIRDYNSKLTQLRSVLEAERKAAQRRGRKAVAHGEKVLATVKNNAAGQKKDDILHSESEERRVRSALLKTMKQLESHRARNLAIEETIARTFEEKDSQTLKLEEIGQELGSLHSEHVSLTCELKAAHGERASLREIQEKTTLEDESRVGDLLSTARVLASNVKTEEGMLSRMLAEESLGYRHGSNEHSFTAVACEERQSEAQAYADMGEELLLKGLARARSELASAASLASGENRARAEVTAAMRQYASEQHLAKLLLT